VVTGVRLSPAEWRPVSQSHAQRADQLTADCRRARARGEKHPVLDFLFTYYSVRPAALRRWHPGPGVALAGAGERADWTWYRVVDGAAFVDAPAFVDRRRATVDFIRDLLIRTTAREPQFGCFGLHEWAMVYQSTPEQVRHRQVPLRLGPAGTDAVVERHRIRCTHFDAFRFFTPAAAPRNELRPTRASQPDLEQPGCLHANMDCYRWATKLLPILPGDLTLDCFELARDIRELDMRASPYDLRALGYEPVAVETVDGKAEYVARQREFTARANELRARLVAAIDAAAAA